MFTHTVAIVITAALMALQSPSSGRLIQTISKTEAASPEVPFDFTDGVLTVTTPAMTLQLARGEIVYLRHGAAGETFADWYSYSGTSRDRIGAPSFQSRGPQGLVSRFIGEGSAGAYTRTGDNTATVSYTAAGQSGATLKIAAGIDGESGDVILRAAASESDPLLTPVSMTAPVANFRTASVILANGARYTRDEAPVQDQTSNEDLGQNAPSMAVIEGASSAIAWSSETVSYAMDWIRLDHAPDRDRIALHSIAGNDRDSRSIESAPLRISAHSTWLDAARRWRERFERRTGARPLWDNRAEWVTRVHAVFNAIANDYGAGSPKFAELANVADPAGVLYFLWNGDRIALFGDSRLVARVGRPRAAELEAIAKWGWPLALYHPYVLVYSEAGERTRLEFLSQRRWLPADYAFVPDFAGDRDQWHAYWADVRAAYDNSLDVLHPAARRTADYLVRNVDDYRRTYGAQGLYFDTAGADHSSLFAPQRQVIDGADFRSGEVSLLSRLAREAPDLGVMSEYQSPRALPFAFYSWEGPATRKARRLYAPYRLNHPLRTALIGSYSWTREDATASPDDAESALMGALPEISLAGDYRVDAERARWSQARARLHCEEGLFHDLPDRWDPDALAYYRGRDGGWFAFKKIGATYGYVQFQPDGTEVVRLMR